MSFVKGATINSGHVEKQEEETPPPPPKTTKKPKKPKKNSLSGSGFANWDSTGIASKMMAKMGYKGGGLGKEGEGISEPIQVNVRPKNMGLAFNDFEERTQQSYTDFGDGPVEEDAPQSNSYSGTTWLTNKQKVQYKQTDNQPYQSKIVDMRGPTVRVINPQSESIVGEEKTPLLPELKYNLTLIVESTESSIQLNEQKITYEKDLVSSLKKQKVSVKEEIEYERSRISQLEAILELITKCHTRIGEGQLDFLLKMFRTMYDAYPKEWQRFQLDMLAFPFVFPQFDNIVQEWNPLDNPAHLVSAVASWKPFLDFEFFMTKLLTQLQLKAQQGLNEISPLFSIDDEDEDINFTLQSMKNPDRVNVYFMLFYSIIFPKIRQCFTAQWNPRDHVKGIKLTTTWLPILPTPFPVNLIEQIILPRLTLEVKSWDPRTDCQPISDWVIPWFPILGKERVGGLWSTILSKIGRALIQWNPMDSTAFIMLKPWKEALYAINEENGIESFLVKAVLPKLEQLMGKWEVNPANQDLTVWNEILKWSTLFSKEEFEIFLLGHFFPKWFSALYLWLQNNPNWEEVSTWYLKWKTQIPENLQKVPRIIQQFQTGLEMIQSSMDPDGNLMAPPPVVAPPRTHKRPSNVPPSPSPSPMAAPPRRSVSTDESISLKDLVEKLAQENNLVFRPLKRTWEGKPVYNLGNLSVVIDKNLIFYLNSGKYEPTGLESLIKRAKR
uniref:G-patch domain-containing protein n=1 Tax=Arcella intermedia TaxID=1963864 RepID=A0A6B2KYG6_9EUKA